MSAKELHKVTTYQAGILKRIAVTGRMMLTHTPSGPRYTDQDGRGIDKRTAELLIHNGTVIAENDSMFDTEAQSYRAGDEKGV